MGFGGVALCGLAFAFQQEPAARNAEAEAGEFLRRLIASENNSFERRHCAERLGMYRGKALPVLRSHLAGHLRMRRELKPLAALLEKLDAVSVLEIEEYGPDAEEAVESALGRADDARRPALTVLLRRIQAAPQGGEKSDPGVLPLLVDLMRQLGTREDEGLLVSLLSDADAPVRKSAMEALVERQGPISPGIPRLILDAADRFPGTTGRAFWRLSDQVHPPGELDLRTLWLTGGPWSRAFALRRLKDPVLLEEGLTHSSRYVREAALLLLRLSKVDDAEKAGHLNRLAADPVASVREAVYEMAAERPSSFGEALVHLAVRGTRTRHVEMILPMSKAMISEETMAAPFRQGNDALALALAPLVNPGRHAALGGHFRDLYGRLPEAQRRPVAAALARLGDETGVRSLKEDLRSTEAKVVLPALNEITQWRLEVLRKEVFEMRQHSNPQVAAAARAASALVAHAEDMAGIQEMLKADRACRHEVARRLAESPRVADGPVLHALVSPGGEVEDAVMTALERLDLKQPLPALSALESSKSDAIRARARAILGRLVYPALLPATLVDLASVDQVRRREALERFRATVRTGLKFRVVAREAALRENVVEIPVAVAHGLLMAYADHFSDLVDDLVDEPLPASFLALKNLLNEQAERITRIVLKRGRKDEVEALLLHVRDRGEISWFLPHLERAAALHAKAVNEFACAWLGNPPGEASPQDFSRLLTFIAGRIGPDFRDDIYMGLFLEGPRNAFSGLLDHARKERPASLLPMVLDCQERGVIKDRSKLLQFFQAVPSEEGVDILKTFLPDPSPSTRMQAASTLGRILHAGAIPLIGEAIHDWFATMSWHVVVELAPGIGRGHIEALTNLEARAPEDRKPLLQVLLYLAGSENHRDSFLAHYPEEDGHRKWIQRALFERAVAPDDRALEVLAGREADPGSSGDLLRLLHRANTPRAAELAQRVLVGAVLRIGISTDGISSGVELVAARIGDPASDLLAEVAIRLNVMDAVRALEKSGSEAAHAALARVARQSRQWETLVAARNALHAATRHARLVSTLSLMLAGQGLPSDPPNALAVLAYLERESEAVEPLVKILKRPVSDASGLMTSLAVLQTLMSVAGTEERIEAALREVTSPPGYPYGTWLGATFRALRGGESGKLGVEPRYLPAPTPAMGAFLCAWARDVGAAIEIVKGSGPQAFAAIRPHLEVVANRPLESLGEAQAWAKHAGGKAPERVIDEGFRSLGYDMSSPEDLKRALKDDRPFVIWNAIWVIRQRAGEPNRWTGPWLGLSENGSPIGLRWSTRGPTPDEIQKAGRR